MGPGRGAMIRKWLAAAGCAALVLAGCGDKVPESQAAKSAGAIPKQIVDKAAADAAKAMRHDAERSQDAEQNRDGQ